MKKVFFLLFMFGAFIKTEAQIQFGGKSGINLSTMYGEGMEVDSDESKPLLRGLNIGAVGILPLGETDALQCELQYSGKGVKIKYDDYDGSSWRR